jgi:hypothetical protein
MRYFTRGFVEGELGEDEQEQVRMAYARRLETILPELPAPLRELSGLSLHDGHVETVTWEPAARRLCLSLVAGHSRRWRTVTLTYSGALLGERRIQTLRDVARDRSTQILADEVDREADGTFSHRLLFWPRDELTIDFTGLELVTAERPDDRVSLRPFFVEKSPEDD